MTRGKRVLPRTAQGHEGISALAPIYRVLDEEHQVDKNAATNDRQTTVSMTVLMTPDMANFSGNVHGGGILKILDQVAFACASTYARGYVVTLSVDRVLFREAIHVGDLVTFSAAVQLHRQNINGDRNPGRYCRYP